MAGASGASTMALARCVPRLPTKNGAGSLGALYIQSPKYSTDADKKVNLTAWKRGTGGRSSFNGVVATVFGATGFVGRYVVNQLGKIGTQMIIPYRCDHYDCARLKVAGDLGQVLFHEFHLRDIKSVEEAVKYSNVVINLIGRDYQTRNFSFNDVHVEGARTIARAARNAGVERLIHLSYLNSAEDPEPIVMKEPSKYKMSKWHGEQVIMDEFPGATIIKASDIYGQEDRFLQYFAHFARRDGQAMFLWKNGEKTEKQPVHVSDIAKAIVKAAQDPDAAGQIYQAAGPKRYRLDVLVDWFYEVMRRDAEWGYSRHDMKFNPFMGLKISLLEKLTLSYPLGNISWEAFEKEVTSDVIVKGIPTLDDLGITLTHMEDIVPWELRPNRAYQYYMESPGEFKTPKPPVSIPI